MEWLCGCGCGCGVKGDLWELLLLHASFHPLPTLPLPPSPFVVGDCFFLLNKTEEKQKKRKEGGGQEESPPGRQGREADI